MFGFPQHNPHHDKDVWDHTIAVIESITPEPVLRWAALLHDIGKPSCFSLAEEALATSSGTRIRVLQWRRVSSVDFASITPAKNKL